MNLKDLIDYCQAAAIADALSAGEEANYRYICRHYSKTFSTPLHIVFKLNPEDVVMAFFEDQMDNKDIDKDLENILDRVYELADPTYTAAKKEELSDFIKQAEAEEADRVAKKKPIHPGMKRDDEVSLKNTPEIPTKELHENPTGGSIDLSYLSSSDNEG